LPEAEKKEGVVVNRSSPDILMVVALSSPKKTYDAIFLGNYCDINLVDAIKRVRGVGDVKNFTAQDYTMRLWLKPDRLASLGVTPTDIQNALKEQNAQSPAGRIGSEPAPPGQESQFNVRTMGLLKDPKQFEEIIVRSNPDGSQVKVKDVGERASFDSRARLNNLPPVHRHLPRSGCERIETANVRKITPRAVPTGGRRHHARFHAPIKASGMWSIRSPRRDSGADRSVHLPPKLPRDDHSDGHGAGFSAGRVHHVPGSRLQCECAHDVRPGAGHRHRRG
jgi:hypothetical protein